MSSPGGELYSIGEVARRFGVSTRTLRYYEEVGLIDTIDKSPGGTRRYSDADIARIGRIMELRSVMGFELDRIAAVVQAENRLDTLRQEYRSGVTPERHAEIVHEATLINDELRAHVADKIAVLQAFSRDLDERAQRLRDLRAELAARTP